MSYEAERMLSEYREAIEDLAVDADAPLYAANTRIETELVGLIELGLASVASR
jgi:hypothetical protein